MAQKLTQIEESKNLKYTPQNLTDEEKEIARENIGANGGASGSSPIGAIIPFGGENVPAGFLLCDGEEYSKEDYKDLYAVIGDYFTKETVTAGYFNVPNLRGKFAEGAEGNLGTNIDAGLPNITGKTKYISANAVWNGTDDGAFTGYGTDKSQINNVQLDGTANAYYFIFDASKSNATYGKSDTVQPPAVAVNFIIKATSTREDLDEIIDDTSHDVGHALSAAEVDRRIEAPNTYSTEEIRIGTWIDGKPIYRQVLTATTQLVLQTNTWLVTNFLIDDKELITECLSIVGNTGTLFHLDCAIDVGDYIRLLTNRPAQIALPVGSKIILEYTKKTD